MKTIFNFVVVDHFLYTFEWETIERCERRCDHWHRLRHIGVKVCSSYDLITLIRIFLLHHLSHKIQSSRDEISFCPFFKKLNESRVERTFTYKIDVRSHRSSLREFFWVSWLIFDMNRTEFYTVKQEQMKYQKITSCWLSSRFSFTLECSKMKHLRVFQCFYLLSGWHYTRLDNLCNQKWENKSQDMNLIAKLSSCKIDSQMDMK